MQARVTIPDGRQIRQWSYPSRDTYGEHCPNVHASLVYGHYPAGNLAVKSQVC